MSKRLALIALLLPLSGFGITKEERKKEIMAEVDQITQALKYSQDIIKNNFWVVYVCPEQFFAQATAAQQRLNELEKEFDEIDKQLEQESHVSTN